MFLCDFATEEIITLSNLRDLPEEFKKEPDGAIRSSLADFEVREIWSEEFSENVKSLLKAYQQLYFVSKVKNISCIVRFYHNALSHHAILQKKKNPENV